MFRTRTEGLINGVTGRIDFWYAKCPVIRLTAQLLEYLVIEMVLEKATAWLGRPALGRILL